MVKMEGTYIQVAYKNVFGYISTNSWPFFMIQRPTIREKCAWVRSNTWRDERPVATSLDQFFFRFFDFSTNIAIGNRKNSEFVQLQPVVRSFAVGFSPISVFFPVQQTGSANTSWGGGAWGGGRSGWWSVFNDIGDAAIVKKLKCAYLVDIPLHRSSGIPLPPVTWPVSIPCPFQWPHSPFAWGRDLSAHRSVVSTKSGPK